MGNKVKEVGGGAATGLSNDLIRFFQQGLSGQFGVGGSGSGSGLNNINIKPPFSVDPDQNTPLDNYSTANPVSRTSSGMANLLNNIFSGSAFGASGTDATKKLFDLQGAGGYDFQPFSVDKVDFSSFNTDLLKNFNPNINPAAFTAANPLNNADFQRAINRTLNASPANLSGYSDFSVANPRADLSPYQDFFSREKMKDVANLRERYPINASGGPAAVAEAQYLAETNARNAATLADIAAREKGIDLQRMAQETARRGQNLDALLANAGLGLQGTGAALNAILGAQGLTQQGQLAARGQDIGAATSAAGLNLDAISKATGLDLAQLEALSRQGIDIGQLFNQYQNMVAGNRLGAAGLDADILSRAGGLDLQSQNLDLSRLGLQSDLLRSILGMMTGIADKGIAQRQVIQQPSAGANVLNTVTSIAKAAAPFFGAPAFARSGGSGAVSDINPNMPAPMSPDILRMLQNIRLGGF